MNSFWNNRTVSDDLPQLLTWLSPLDPGLRHCDIQERRVSDVGEWLTQTEKFRRWGESGEEGEGDEAVLFCYGNPRVGKTFIGQKELLSGDRRKLVLASHGGSSLVVDWLCDQAGEQNIVVGCFYFDFAT